MPWITTKEGKHINTDWFDEDEKRKEKQIAENEKQAAEKNDTNSNIFRFQGNAKSNDTFDRDGAEECKQFFDEHSNYLELIKEMSESERESFEGWASGDFMEGQQLRKFSTMSELNQSDVKTYDKYLDKAILDTPIQVKRIGKISDFSLDKHIEGDIILSTVNMSAAAAAEGLGKSNSSNNVYYTIDIPKSKGAGMFIGNSLINHWGISQREFMLNRDCKYKIKSIKNINGKKYVELEWVGKEDHSYD